nr:type I-E CRISPR-associated endoribonuclease Cas2e [uncultured Cohaesibacter sp.]
MPATLVITRDVEMRYRGYLTSIMLELSAGVYLAPTMSAAVRERTWEVLSDWHMALGRGAIVMAWPDRKAAGGMVIQTLGDAPKEIVDADGVLLVRR